MASIVACTSRFSVLKIEDDEESEPVCVKEPPKVSDKQTNNKKKAKKKKKAEEKETIAELQSLAFNTKVKKKASNKSSIKNQPVSQEQWEEWKQKDNEFVADTYEQDLQQAILLSKLDYEEKKELYDANKNDQGKSCKSSKKSSKKKEKPPSMSLEQFNNLLPSQIENISSKDSPNPESENVKLKTVISAPEDLRFFEKVAEDTEKIINKEHQVEAYKKAEPFIAQAARSLQFQDEIEKRDKEIEQLKTEVINLKDELMAVKARNKKLCSIFAEGKMKEKAEILIQVDQLTTIKDELTEQVAELHAALEQEKSKVHNLQAEFKKLQSGRKESQVKS